MRNTSDRRVTIRHNGVELTLVDCMHWSPADGTPECLAKHDVSQCDTCEFKQVRPVFSRIPSAAHADAERNVMRGLRGLGDVVAAMTTAVGIAPCGGCKERQEQLNRIIPFGKQDENGTTTTPTA
jgi:hypothetical protein